MSKRKIYIQLEKVKIFDTINTKIKTIKYNNKTKTENNFDKSKKNKHIQMYYLIKMNLQVCIKHL